VERLTLFPHIVWVSKTPTPDLFITTSRISTKVVVAYSLSLVFIEFYIIARPLQAITIRFRAVLETTVVLSIAS